MKIVTMHQPNYLPWIGFFSKIFLTDCLIIYNCAQYEKDSVVNRNKIRTYNGFAYLTIPVSHQYLTSRILDVPLPPDKKWRQDHWRQIYQNYVKTPYFKHYQEFFEGAYQGNYQYLWQLNESILLYLLKCFHIDVEIIRTSDLNVCHDLHKTDLMLAYLKMSGADVYLSGPSGRNYLECEKFQQSGIDLKYFNFQHPVYQQRYPGFQPNMSAIDLLFNIGPQSSEIIKASGSVEQK